MINLEILSLILFFLIVVVWLLKDRKNIQFFYGISIRRWTRGLHLIDTLIKNYSKFITVLGNVGVAVGILVGLGGFAALIILTVQFQQTFALVLPTAGGYQIPGPVISVPFWYWFIAIFIILFTHESMHAVFVRLEKVKVRNYGIVLLLLLPVGAFVDPDENRIKKLPTLKKLRIYVAGAFTNIITAILALVIVFASVFAFTIIVKNSGVTITSVVDNSPAAKVGLHGTIVGFDNATIKNQFDILKSLNETKPGQNVTIMTTDGSYQLTLAENPENKNKSYIGIFNKDSYNYNILGSVGVVPQMVLDAFFSVISFLRWFILISVAIGIVNLLPAKPLDGGLFFEEIFTKLFKEKGKLLIKFTSILILLLILFSVFGIPLLKNFILR